MRKSILFVLMVMVLFVVSVMPMAAHEGEDQGWHHAPALSMPQCRDYDTMRMWWHTGDGGDDPAPVGWGLTRWFRTWVASSYGYDVPTGRWTVDKVFTSGWTRSGKYWDFDDTSQLQLEKMDVYPYKQYRYALVATDGAGAVVGGISPLTLWKPSYGCHKK